MDKVLSNEEFMDSYMDDIPEDMFIQFLVEESLNEWAKSLKDPDAVKDKELALQIAKSWGFKKDSPMWYIVNGFIEGLTQGMIIMEKIERSSTKEKAPL